MARTSTTISFVAREERYYWPDAAINIWIIVMLGTAGVLIGIFADFIVVQNHFEAPTPWIFPFGITVGVITVIFIVLLLGMIAQARLLPAMVIVLSITLFALFLTGAIETGIQLFGSNGNVNSLCQNYVIGHAQNGRTLYTLVWLEQNGICQAWYAVFAFWLLGALFLVWLIVIAAAVSQKTSSS